MSLGFPSVTARDAVPVFTQFLHLTGLPRAPIENEKVAVAKFMELPALSVDAVVTLARAFSRHVELRSKPGMNTYDETYDAPNGGPDILKETDKLVRLASRPNERATPHAMHIRWMCLLPLTEANLITGLALWCWMRRRIDGGYPRDFHEAFYREVLEAARE